ncbi:hypothetical protein L6452_01746 [Arctium lappa]|uniref:Uncharacterized protein n=1 Tax=Arctium lappa TaxID=4217 RepID=A0ACB9FIT7_ARCLA|nr:hypothetical protein L6452_01746 [Arctium lappa]
MEAWTFTTLQMAMGENVISEIVSEKTATMKEGTNIKAHITEFEDIIMKLKATNALIAKDEEALAMILFQGLFADRGQDDQWSSRGRNRGRSQFRQHGSRGKSKTRGNCNYCHKPVHWVNDCTSLTNKDKDNAESSVVAAEEEQDGFSAIITPPQADSIIVMKGEQVENNLFHLIGETISPELCVAESSKNLDVARLWHLRLGHTSEKNLEILRKQKLIKVVIPTSLEFCSGCVKGKQMRVSFGVGKHNTKGILDYVHTDVWGPSIIPSLSRDVFDTFNTWLARVEVETGKKLKVLRSDNGGEFTSGNFKNFCFRKGIHHHYTTPGDPQSNGVAERINRTLLEKVGCQDKLNPKATKGFLLGYTYGIKGYRIWNPLARKVIHSRHVTFNESVLLKSQDLQSSQDPEVVTIVAPTPDDMEIVDSPYIPGSSTIDISS